MVVSFAAELPPGFLLAEAEAEAEARRR